jgi:hypothetical protein
MCGAVERSHGSSGSSLRSRHANDPLQEAESVEAALMSVGVGLLVLFALVLVVLARNDHRG